MKRCFIIPNSGFSVDFLKQHIRGKDTILATNLSALMATRRYFEDVAVIEDLIAYEEIECLATRANDLAQMAPEYFCHGESLDGYNWAEICWYAQLYFFRDILQAQALASSLKKDEFERVVWVGSRGQKPGYYFSTSDTVQSALRYYLGDRFENIQTSSKLTEFDFDYYKTKIKNGMQRLRKHFLDPTPGLTKCDVAAFFSTTEWERFTNALDDLCGEYGDQFQVWFLGKIPKGLREWTRARGVSSVRISYPNSLEKDIMAFFNDQWEYWIAKQRYVLAEETGCGVLSSDLLQYHFAFYFKQLWPKVAQWGRKIERYLILAQPHWVIGSTAYSHVGNIAQHVAAKLDITSLALPHAYVQGSHGLIGSSFLACRNQFERENFRKPFPDDQRAMFCKNAGNDVSYNTNPLAISSIGDTPVITVLTAEPEAADCLMATGHRHAFMDTLKRIFFPPTDLSDLQIVIKSHPRSDISVLLRECKGRGAPNVEVLDPSTSVIELLGSTWITVVCDHYGSVVVQAVWAEKPVIFLDSAKIFWPHTKKLAFSAGEVVEDISGLWALVRQLKGSLELYQDLCEKCRNFKVTYLQHAEQTVTECMRSVEKRQVSMIPNAEKRAIVQSAWNSRTVRR
jgi:hypothetical protein